MKLKRNYTGLVLLGLFVAYFAASSIFVPPAPGLKEITSRIVTVQCGDDHGTNEAFRFSSASEEDETRTVDFFFVSHLESFHTSLQLSKLTACQEISLTLSERLYLSNRSLLI